MRTRRIDVNDALVLSAERAETLSRIWNDAQIRETLGAGKTLHWDENAPYFLDKLDELSSSSYTPTDEDFLRLRTRTVGIVETRFDYKKMHICLIDVGGQKTERKKWIHAFDGVDVLLFVVSVSDFNLTMEEAGDKSRLQDALTLFEDVICSPFFNRRNVVVFLNKMDVLEEKLKRGVCIRDYVDDFEGDADKVEDVVAYYEAKLRAANQSHARELYFHHTTALDTGMMDTVFSAVIDQFVSEALAMFQGLQQHQTRGSIRGKSNSNLQTRGRSGSITRGRSGSVGRSGSLSKHANTNQEEEEMT